MGMESVYKLSVILNLVDNLSGQMGGVGDNVSGVVNRLNSAFGTMQKAGAAMAGIGAGITGLCMKTVTSTFDTQNALGELSSLGVKDLKAVEDAAKSFSDTWAGTSKSDFITASYDIKSGIASLTDEGVAPFCYPCLNVLNPHLPCTVRLTIQGKELIKGQVFKAFRKQFLGKVGVYDHLPIAHKAAYRWMMTRRRSSHTCSGNRSRHPMTGM